MAVTIIYYNSALIGIGSTGIFKVWGDINLIFATLFLILIFEQKNDILKKAE